MPKGPCGGVRKPWLKLQITHARSPARAYITGTKEKVQPLKLIVEVSRARTPHYVQVCDEIYSKLEADMLTKEEAVELRNTLSTPWL